MDGKKKWLWLGAAVLAGYMFSDKIGGLPLVSKLPKF
jgi:hypothetical protein